MQNLECRIQKTRCVSAICAALVLLGSVSPARAAESRFQNVTLLTTADRVSVVFELTAEPRNVATRRVSAAILELDAEPVVTPVRPTSFSAPRGVRFVSGVSIQGATPGSIGLKARITLLERARSAVRVVGRRVYVDFSPDATPEPPRIPEPTAPPARVAPTPAPTGPPAPEPVATASTEETYRAAIRPALEQLDKLAPFLLSAASSPSAAVLNAVGDSLKEIESLVNSVDVPAASRRGHGLLSAAVALATTAVDPAFNGDRAAQARQALSLLDRAKASW